ncbi:condensation domain-containing protein, partial [Nonomuraea sp. NPDC050405]
MISLGQERLWFLQRLDPSDAAYRVAVVRRLRGTLDVEALTGAFADVVERHESLRTRFPDQDGLPVAVVDPPGPVPVELMAFERPAPEGPVLDQPVLDQPVLDEVARLLGERVNAPFDLASAPPLRITLVRLADDDHVLCVVLHHIIGDGWSLNVLMNDLAAFYLARTEGAPVSLPGLPVRYAEYADAQRLHDAGADIGYWTGRLAGATPLELPTDRPRPA